MLADVLALTGVVLAAPPTSITEEEAVRLAIEASASLRAADASVREARAGLEAGQLGLVPEVRLTAGYQRIDGFPDGEIAGPGGMPITIEIPRDRWSAQASLQYSILEILIERLQTIDALESTALAEELRRSVRRADIRLEAKVRFHRFIGATETASVARASLRLAEVQLDRVQARFEVGEATRADQSAARARLEARRAELVRADGQRRRALLLLRSYLGRPDLPPFIPPPGWDAIAPRAGLEGEPEALVKRAAERRPELEVLLRQAEAQDSLRTASWADILPELQLSASYLQANPNPNLIPPREEFDDSWNAGVKIVWSLERALIAGARRGETEAARQRLLAERDDMMRRIEEQVRSALIELESARAVHRASKARVSAARQRFEARTAAFELGRATIDELLDADLDLARARLEVISAVVEHHVARARLERFLTLEG